MSDSDLRWVRDDVPGSRYITGFWATLYWALVDRPSYGMPRLSIGFALENAWHNRNWFR